MNLKENRKKRSFKRVSEPFQEFSRESEKRFVVQKHQARHLHYDFRLELDGVLRSWALPKEFPKNPGEKRLAVEVEDHSINYINFEGEIPEGMYGAGRVEIWDKGTYVLLNRQENELEFVLKGSRLKGRYVLIRTHWQGKKNNWLIVRLINSFGPISIGKLKR